MKRLSLFSFLLTIIFCLTSCEEPVVTVSSIILNSSALDMTEGDSFKLTATVRPDNATDKTLIWSSSNASIASVEDGLVTAVKEGAATITVASKDGGAKATCEVTVATRVIDVESVTLDQKEATLTVGKSLTLKATVLPDNATDKTVTWTSNNTSVATVSNGEVKAVGVHHCLGGRKERNLHHYRQGSLYRRNFSNSKPDQPLTARGRKGHNHCDSETFRRHRQDRDMEIF